MTKIMAYGYSHESTQRELSNEYQDDRVKMDLRNICIMVLWTKVAPALEGLCAISHKFCLSLSHEYYFADLIIFFLLMFHISM